MVPNWSCKLVFYTLCLLTSFSFFFWCLSKWKKSHSEFLFFLREFQIKYFKKIDFKTITVTWYWNTIWVERCILKWAFMWIHGEMEHTKEKHSNGSENGKIPRRWKSGCFLISLCALVVLTAFNGVSSAQRSTAYLCVYVLKIWNFPIKKNVGFLSIPIVKTTIDDVSREIVKLLNRKCCSFLLRFLLSS